MHAASHLTCFFISFLKSSSSDRRSWPIVPPLAANVHYFVEVDTLWRHNCQSNELSNLLLLRVTCQVISNCASFPSAVKCCCPKHCYSKFLSDPFLEIFFRVFFVKSCFQAVSQFVLSPPPHSSWLCETHRKKRTNIVFFWGGGSDWREQMIRFCWGFSGSNLLTPTLLLSCVKICMGFFLLIGRTSAELSAWTCVRYSSYPKQIKSRWTKAMRKCFFHLGNVHQEDKAAILNSAKSTKSSPKIQCASLSSIQINSVSGMAWQ